MTAPENRTDDDSWTHGGGGGFGAYEDRDEQLHPEHRVPHDSLTETWAYMFWIPKQRISSIIYLWVHPNLGVLTGGLTVYRGHKSHHLQAEIFDIPIFNSAAPCIHDNGLDIQVPNGLRVQILEPFKSIRVRYADDSRGNSDRPDIHPCLAADHAREPQALRPDDGRSRRSATARQGAGCGLLGLSRPILGRASPGESFCHSSIHVDDGSISIRNHVERERSRRSEASARLAQGVQGVRR